MTLDAILRAAAERAGTLQAGLGDTRDTGEHRSLAGAILSRQAGVPAIIGEIKPSSPTTGPIRPVSDATHLASAFTRGGCRGLSVLTEPAFFGGSLSLHAGVRAASPLPVLRKDFIIDSRQVAESVAAGADALLLIAGILGDRLDGMVRKCLASGIEPLVEVHTKAEAEVACTTGATLVGVNNRDLATMTLSMETVPRLAPMLREEGRLVIAMSGYGSPQQVRDLSPYCDAVLVGTALMKAPDPETLARRLSCA